MTFCSKYSRIALENQVFANILNIIVFEISTIAYKIYIIAFEIDVFV